MKLFKIAIGIYVFFISSIQNNLFAQDPLRFQTEVKHLDTVLYHFDPHQETVLFTGSSSIRKWKNIAMYYPDIQWVNTGFGGSQMSDLYYFANELIIKYQPDQVFIYEGDNDIAEGKQVPEIMKVTKQLVIKLQKDIPGVEIVLISAKPSLARWKFKEQYVSLNIAIRNYCKANRGLTYADVWQVMLNEQGKPKEGIFVEDGLHLNKDGYDLWAKELGKYLIDNK